MLKKIVSNFMKKRKIINSHWKKNEFFTYDLETDMHKNLFNSANMCQE